MRFTAATDIVLFKKENIVIAGGTQSAPLMIIPVSRRQFSTALHSRHGRI